MCHFTLHTNEELLGDFIGSQWTSFCVSSVWHYSVCFCIKYHCTMKKPLTPVLDIVFLRNFGIKKHLIIFFFLFVGRIPFAVGDGNIPLFSLFEKRFFKIKFERRKK